MAKTPIFVRWLLPEATWRINTNEKILYLTFDDGPTPVVTEEVLDLLKKYNAKATFFCIGKNVVAHSEIMQKIKEDGHALGNHTFNHLKGWKTTNGDYRKDVEACAEVLSSELFRPPYGRIKRSQYKDLIPDFHIIMWDVLSWDFVPDNSPERCANHVIKNAKPGSIIVFHDSEKARINCLYSLEKTLEVFSQKGFRFEKL